MANITAGMVKELRDKTGAGMMDCKAAFNETAGDLEGAVDWLRKKGLAKAAKKAGRVAAEGLIGVARRRDQRHRRRGQLGNRLRRPQRLFQGLVKMIADVALDVGADVDKILAAPVGDHSVADAINETIAKVGENMTLRRAAAISVGKGALGKLRAQFGHRRARPHRRHRGAESTGNADELKAFGRMVAMHVASANPQAIDAAGLDAASRAREGRARGQGASAQGKPANVIDKIVEFGTEDLLQGGLPARSALHLRRQEERRAGAQGEPKARPAAPIKVAGFVRYALGEGIDRPEGDFGGEVAALAGAH